MTPGLVIALYLFLMNIRQSLDILYRTRYNMSIKWYAI